MYLVVSLKLIIGIQGMFMAYLYSVEDVLKLIQLAFNYIFRIWPTFLPGPLQ